MRGCCRVILGASEFGFPPTRFSNRPMVCPSMTSWSTPGSSSNTGVFTFYGFGLSCECPDATTFYYYYYYYYYYYCYYYYYYYYSCCCCCCCCYYYYYYYYYYDDNWTFGALDGPCLGCRLYVSFRGLGLQGLGSKLQLPR